MRAVVYGPSHTLQLAEIEKPVPAGDEVLLRVRAAAVNPLDGHLLKAPPWLRKLMFAMIATKVRRPGADISGEVEAVGRNVTRFKPGDAVFGGSGGGAFAEYACPRESKVVAKPPGIGFEAAACVNVAGITALQGLRDVAGVVPGQKVLINGASGGVGTFAVQIAKWMGADVTAVCSTRNVNLARGLGADRVIDYTCENILESDERFDVIFDLVSDKPLLELRRILTPEGKWIGAGVLGVDTSMINMIASSLKTPLLSLFTGQKFTSFMAKTGSDDLQVLAKLIETGHIAPVIDRTFSLDEVPDAVRYVDTKRARGKVVISVGE
ncbi:MAG: NAD(P)-dependent alcohol dehydrogenase [Acidobacteria bacterium]|nr:NAD(P)-dependent alcohol dehydrogenase [Acidobacteriota bacterium]